MPKEHDGYYIDPLAQEVFDQYTASYIAKESEGKHDEWIKYHEYWKGDRQDVPKGSPGRNVNIVRNNIESMVADITMDPLEVLLEGWSASDRAYAPHAQKALEWVWKKNRMFPKRDKFTRQRCKLGASAWKVYFDGQGPGIMGMPMIEPVSPANFFPDPKVKSKDMMYMADYIIHALPRPTKYVKRVYGSAAREVHPAPHPTYNPEFFGDNSTFGEIAGDKVLLLERWTLEDNEEGNLHLRKVVVAVGYSPIVLYDSDEDEDEERRKKGFYAINRYPFVLVPAVESEGTLWGESLVKGLCDVQDTINDLDDQIMINARMTGNIQKVVSVSSGINPKKWTNEPGLTIPTRDINGWRLVQPPSMPAYIMNRRNEARDIEAPLVSGRPDIVEGRKPGSLRAAAAILALQEQGQKHAIHMKSLDEEGLVEVFTIILDYITEYWDIEQEIGTEVTSFTGGEDSKEGEKSEDEDETPELKILEEPVMFRGADLQEVEVQTPDGEPILGDDGQPMTKVAEFDISVNIGGGFVNNKAFVYQAVIELVQYNIITQEEARTILKNILSFPIIDPYNPEGNFSRQPHPAKDPQPMQQEQQMMQQEQQMMQQPQQGPEMALGMSPGQGQMPGGIPSGLEDLDPALVQQAMQQLGLGGDIM